MTQENALDSRHPVVRFHRFSVVVIGLAMAVFGVLGYLGDVGSLDTHGRHVLGLTSDHLLGVCCLVLALVLLGSALSARAAARTAVIVGGLLLVVSLLSMA